MEVRPYLTAGAAIVSTGALVVAMPAIVPSPTPPDVRVSAAVPESVYADVALRQSSQDLFNAIFSGFPDTTGPRGLVGVASLLTENVPLVNDFVTGGVVGVADVLTTDIPLVNSFVTGGIVGLATELFGADPVAAAFLDNGIVGVANLLTTGIPFVNSFVTGGVVGVADELTAGDPLTNSFVNGGIVGLASFLTPDDTLAQTFLDGGFTAATEEVLVNATASDPVVSQGISSFFSGYPFEVPEVPAVPDDPNIPGDQSVPAVPAVPVGPAGIVGLVHYILDRLAGNPTVPVVEEEGAGGDELPQAVSFAEEAGDPQDSLLQATDTTVNPGARTFNLNVGQLRTGAVDPVDTLDPVDTTDQTAVDTTDQTTVDTTDPDPTVTPVGANTGSGSVPAGQPPVGSTPPPATDPVVDPVDPAPTDPVSNEEDGEDGKQLTEEELNSGNKVTPDPILLQNGRGGGGSAWDQTVQRWKDFGAKLGLGGGAAPAAPSAPDTGAAEGADGTS